MKSQLLVRGPDGSFEGELAVYNQIDLIPRFVNVGSWSIQAPVSDLALQLGVPGWGISYRRNDKTIISGPQNLKELKFDANTNTIIASGLSDLVALSDKLVYPSAYPFSSDDYDDQGPAPAETVIKHYTGVALGDPSRLPGGGVPEVSIAPDLGRGGDVTEHGRFQNLLEFCQGLALAGGNLGFDIIDYEFDIYETTDRSAEQVLSVESGSVSAIDTKATAPTATRIIVGAQGEGTARVFTQVTNSAAETRWGRVIEVFLDARDTSDPDVLVTRGTDALLKGAEKTTLTITPKDVPYRKFFEDWYLGDTVSDGQGLSGLATEAHLTINMDGELVEPKIDSSNTATANSTLRAFDAIRKLNTRMLNLERSP